MCFLGANGCYTRWYLHSEVGMQKETVILAGKEDDEFHFGYVEFDMFLGIQVEMPSEAAGHRIVALRSQTWAGR